jgi:NADH-quinone oxidoreductase subunit I
MPYLINRHSRMSLWHRIYLPGIILGMLTTARHFFTNLLHPRRRMTVEYPEQRRVLPAGVRSEHRLLSRPDGSIRCTACMLCAWVCPADCIAIIAAEIADPAIEKRPARFEIDLLRCVFCGLCVEACPCDAIRMDTGRYENASFTRSALLYGMERLCNNAAPGSCTLSRSL